MPRPLPLLRANLDFLPSPVPDRPGLLIRDPLRYSDATLVIPPLLVQCLPLFDGRSSEHDISALLARAVSDPGVCGDAARHLVDTLSRAGFLDDVVYTRLRAEARDRFAATPARAPLHAGSAYPESSTQLRAMLARALRAARQEQAHPRDDLVGIAAPHASIDATWPSYAAAYALLGDALRDRTFVILGTSHYGEPDRFGVTRKPFETPLGHTSTDLPLVDELVRRGGPAVEVEDYCHSVEHSIEFQVLFLQHLFGADVRIVPVLCGAFARGLLGAGPPERDAGVARVLDTLGDIARRDAGRLFWILGVDMAHIGPRYGDGAPVRADEGQMLQVAERDRARIERLTAADPDGFWSLVREEHDDLRWCGASPFYTFLRAVPHSGGALARYQQWQIDESSVVSLGAVGFFK